MDKQTEEIKSSKNNSWTVGSFFFVGCMFLGMGIGQLFDARQIGMYFGMGAGMIAFGAVQLLRKSK